MRRKLNEIRNKEEGFTLVELLAVIVILGIIMAIAIPAVGNVINKADKDAEKAEYALIVDAGRLYLTAEREQDGKEKGHIDVGTLITEGYIEERDGNNLSTDYKNYIVKKDGTTYKLYTAKANGEELYPDNKKE